MTYLVRRTCTEIGGADGRDKPESGPRPLDVFRDSVAYVLLGAPGAGKTETFTLEAAECPDGCPVTARDFLTFDDRPEWHGATLFIDGLDEVRAGAVDGRTPFDAIRRKLESLGRPDFRLSCREAHWFGVDDRKNLEHVSRSAKVEVLRLDPLSEDNIREILCRCPGIEDAVAFVAAARELGIDGLLANPLSLRMLAGAVADGIWPETRIQTFEQACRKLVREHNVQHWIVTPQRPDESDLLNVAGRLCALQLLTGSAGYVLSPSTNGDRDYPELDQIPGDDRTVLRHVLDTKLFDAHSNDPSENRVGPVHRQIAEFLAARYLASLVDDGLPVGRIVSLIVGHDGVVVSEHRGLSAWLAAHSSTARAELIARDPVGTMLYGDVRGFSIHEKRRLMDGVSVEAKKRLWITGTLSREPRLADLATPDMAEMFARGLGGPARDHGRQSLVLLLLAALGKGEAMPQLASLILQIVRDDTWLQGVRTAALDALIRHGETYGLTPAEFRGILADIDAGSISDIDDELRGALLTELYPAELSVTELLHHLRPPKILSYFGGSYFSFWLNHVPWNSTTAQLAELLDLIAGHVDSMRPKMAGTPGDINYLRSLPARLLKRVMHEAPEGVPAGRLLDWLGVVSDPALRISPHDTSFIRPWLTGHPDLLKSLIALGVERCSGSAKFSHCMRGTERALFHTPWPPDWCLEKALAATERDPAEYFICRVADYVHSNPGNGALTRIEVERRLAGNAVVAEPFNRRLAALGEHDSLERDIREEDDEERAQRRRKWQSYVEAHERALRENRCPPRILHNLARVYFGEFVDVEGTTPRERLKNLLGANEVLIQAVLQGLRGSLERDDLPTGAEVVRLGTHKQLHYLAWPILAGLEEATRVVSNPGLWADEELLRLALAIHYTVARPYAAPRSPSWFSPLLSSHPELVCELLVESVLSCLREGADPSTNLHDLVQSRDHENVARLASLPLLRKFPVRCTHPQLSALGILLEAALLHGEADALEELVREKLSRRSMNVAQRVYWLAAGAMASPSSSTMSLAYFVAGNERRIRHLADFVASRFRLPDSLLARLDAPALKLFISLTGSSFRPFYPRSHVVNGDDEDGRRVSEGMEASLGIARFIERLASLPSRNASEALEVLLCDVSLRPWHAHLVDAAYRQNVLRREHGFQHFGVGAVLEVLKNRRPANAADLAALTMAHLQEIGRRIRDGNTSDWRQYWNVDSKNRPLDPKPEDACRDALLSDLQAKLKGLDIDAQPEGRYAEDKRSDIRVWHGGFNVPVEIKKSSHRDLWSSIRTQLIASYTRDPDTGGCGIYLVFWHGAGRCQPPESGAVPETAAGLGERLHDTLSSEEARVISVLVIDVSAPIS